MPVTIFSSGCLKSVFWQGNTFRYNFIVHLPLNFVLSFPSLLLWVYLLWDFFLFVFKSSYNLLTWNVCSCISASLQRFAPPSHISSLSLINVTVVIFLDIFPRLSLGFKIHLVVLLNSSLQFRIALFHRCLFLLDAVGCEKSLGQQRPLQFYKAFI